MQSLKFPYTRGLSTDLAGGMLLGSEADRNLPSMSAERFDSRRARVDAR
jgi:hypothetical protein